jgi:hypothetical protein
VAVPVHRRGAAHRQAGRRRCDDSARLPCWRAPTCQLRAAAPRLGICTGLPYHLETSVPGCSWPGRARGESDQAGRIRGRRGRQCLRWYTGTWRCYDQSRLQPAHLQRRTSCGALFLFEKLSGSQLAWLCR